MLARYRRFLVLFTIISLWLTACQTEEKIGIQADMNGAPYRVVSVAELQAMLDALDRAIFSGTRRVQFSDGGTSRMVEYNSMDELRKARADLAAQLQAATSSAPSSFSLATHSRD